MRIPLLSSKKVVQEIKPVLIVKYVLPKREIVKVCVAVFITEMMIHAPVRKQTADRLKARVDDVVDKVDGWLDTEPGAPA